MFRVGNLLDLVSSTFAIEIYDTVFRLSGEHKLLWSGSFHDDSVPEDLLRRKVLHIAPGESYVLKIWVR